VHVLAAVLRCRARPAAKSLKDTLARTPALLRPGDFAVRAWRGQRTLVVAHGNSLRAADHGPGTTFAEGNSCARNSQTGAPVIYGLNPDANRCLQARPWRERGAVSNHFARCAGWRERAGSIG